MDKTTEGKQTDERETTKKATHISSQPEKDIFSHSYLMYVAYKCIDKIFLICVS